MRVLVIYDSTYGNTEKIARAIGGAITGDVRVLRVSEANPADIKSLDLLIIGSPTQGGRATQAMQDFLNKINVKGMSFASFDTRFSTKLDGLFGYAAGRIADSLKKKGGNLITSPTAFFVAGREGPLKDGELERAANWGKELVKGKK
jgi:flavodoxin I